MEQNDLSVIADLLDVLKERGGTDLLVTAGAPPLCRVDGAIVPMEGRARLTPEDTEHLVRGCLSDDSMAELQTEREIDFSLSWRGVGRFRGNAFYQRGALALSLRNIPLIIPTIAQVGLPARVVDFLSQSQGLLLVTGPTGSGKSTSLAAMIDWINENRATHIITIEDPIEYLHHHKRSAVDQREIGEDTISYPRALRAALREDPDIVLVGEMRDEESIQTTLTIAETGHLVFATLHTNDTATAVDRIVDVFPTDRQHQIRVQLAAVLVGVLAQRLLPKTGGGLVAAYELMVANLAVRSLVREGRTAQIRNVIMTSRDEGMQTLESDLSRLVAEGLVAHEIAIKHAMVAKDVVPLPPESPDGSLAPAESGGRRERR